MIGIVKGFEKPKKENKEKPSIERFWVARDVSGPDETFIDVKEESPENFVVIHEDITDENRNELYFSGWIEGIVESLDEESEISGTSKHLIFEDTVDMRIVERKVNGEDKSTIEIHAPSLDDVRAALDCVGIDARENQGV